MAEGKRSYPVGTVLLLAGPPDGKVIDIPLTVVEEVDKDTLRVKGVNGDIFRVHKSRIKKVIKEVEDKPAENQVPEAQGPVAKKPKEQTSTKHVEKEKEEEIPMEAEATAVQEQPKIKESSKAKASKAKPSKGNLSRKEKEKVIPFNPKEWAKNGVLLAKTSPFDHATHKLTCYVAVDAKGGFYHTINSYKHGNVESLGKNGKGGNSYPLKGHQCTVKKKGKTSIHHGKRTAEEEIARFLKEGYKQIK